MLDISFLRSAADVLVKVIANIFLGSIPSSINREIRLLIAKLFPDPGPASERITLSLLIARLYTGEPLSSESFHAILSPPHRVSGVNLTFA